ncbi:MAG: NgoBV family restriction endonuclease [Acinetobacter sp.]|nr:NgoBV family restriction endonuclease [Acinetobacter sp.]
MYHSESIRIYDKLVSIKETLTGGTHFRLGDVSVNIEDKDGIGGLIEEWFGVWASQNGFLIHKTTAGQEFPDYFVGNDNGLLEIKTFDRDASANFDIANFESYCISLANNPHRLNSDYLIFGYRIKNGVLSVADIWLKKVWEITCASKRWPLKTQTKGKKENEKVIYNIRPATWYSRGRYPVFNNAHEFVNALYATQQAYRGRSDLALFQQNSINL